uniref:Outer membrane receptor proteins, mostly Fe transport n=1 Tax=Candidatus Kentrum sp. FW TaxID=2126338 RepID=A0A450THZ1_9GAMM|nr:MAG: Outer membrane receptor proteins, mostly Fe transport [Candidatus Kentron sp. FW]
MKRKNTLFRNSLWLALLGPILALGAPIIALADSATIDTKQDKNLPAGKQSEQGGPIELDPIVAIGRLPASTVVLGREVDTPSNRRLQDLLKGMTNILDNEGPERPPAIRGITGGDSAPDMIQTMMKANNPRVNTLVDGVARPYKVGHDSGGSASALSGLWDVETVEVAKGPQSTSTGRSSLTGAVNVSTRDPVHEWEFAVRTGWFNEPGTVEGALMANLPLVTDQVALRFTAEGSDGEHYVDYSTHSFGAAYGDEADEVRFEHYRGKLLLTPNFLPDTQLVFSSDVTTSRDGSPYVEDWRAKDLVIKDHVWGQARPSENELTVHSAKLLQGLGEKMDLEVQVSYLDNTFQIIRSPRVVAQQKQDNFRSKTETTSAEALLHFEELGFIDEGLLGVAYEYKDDTSGQYGIDPTNLSSFDSGWYFETTGDAENYAIFGEIEAGIGGGFTAIAGGRFEWNDSNRHLHRVSAYSWNRDSEGGVKVGDEARNEAFLPKLGIRYDGADKYVAGYTYSKGWRPGGIDMWMVPPEMPVTVYDPEYLKNHEIWVRSNPTKRLSLNGSVFYYLFEDMQIRARNYEGTPAFTFPIPGLFKSFASRTDNIPEVKGYGMELDGQFAINDAWTISGGLGLLKTEVTDPGPYIPEYKGQALSQTPDATWNLGLGWVSPRGFDAEIRARHTGSFRQSHKIMDTEGQYLEETAPYTLFDLKAGYETKFRGTELRIDAWVANLTDKRYKLPTFHEYLDKAGRPRTFGVAVTARF